MTMVASIAGSGSGSERRLVSRGVVGLTRLGKAVHEPRLDIDHPVVGDARRRISRALAPQVVLKR